MSTTALMSFFPFVYEQPKSMYMYVCVEFTVYTCLYSTVQTNMYSIGLSDRYQIKKNESSFHMSVCQVLLHLKVFSLFNSFVIMSIFV